MIVINILAHLAEDNVSIANWSWSSVQVQNAVSTKEAGPVYTHARLLI